MTFGSVVIKALHSRLTSHCTGKRLKKLSLDIKKNEFNPFSGEGKKIITGQEAMVNE